MPDTLLTRQFAQQFDPIRRSISRALAPALLTTVLYGLHTPAAWSQSEASLELSALPVASVVVAGSAASVAAGASAAAVVAIPAVLLISGAQLVVVAIEASAQTTVLVLERTSDGARASIALGVEAGAGSAYSVGTVLTTTVISAGVLISAAGEVIAFIPNEIGQALIYNERL